MVDQAPVRGRTRRPDSSLHPGSGGTKGYEKCSHNAAPTEAMPAIIPLDRFGRKVRIDGETQR